MAISGPVLVSKGKDFKAQMRITDDCVLLMDG
jgi:hypothetical protein